MNKARIFISCGQNPKELKIATDIVEKIMKLKDAYPNDARYLFETDNSWPYVAKIKQETVGVVDGIFDKLKEAEYVIFIDFNREKIWDSFLDIFARKRRGSLFSNQELAIATFLKKKILAFQEKGVKEQDGILQFVKINPEPFSDRNGLGNMVMDAIINQIKSGEWRGDWRDELQIKDELSQAIADPDVEQGPDGRVFAIKRIYFNLRVENLHYEKIAQSCAVFLESAIDLATPDKPIRFSPVELKWDKVRLPAMNIPPDRLGRKFHPFRIEADFFDKSHEIQLVYNREIVDFLGLRNEYILRGPDKDFELKFVLYSANFPIVTKSFKLHIGKTINEIRFEPV